MAGSEAAIRAETAAAPAAHFAPTSPVVQSSYNLANYGLRLPRRSGMVARCGAEPASIIESKETP